MKRFLLAALLAAGPALAEPAWPAPEAPEGARIVEVAPEVVLNGQRSRILQVTARSSVDALAAHYRQRFGARRVENTVGDAKVIATRSGEFFHTVRIRSLGAEGVQATLVTTALAAAPLRSAAMQDTEAWLPPDTATQQTMESRDGGLRSVTVIAANAQSVQANRELLLQAMARRGLSLASERAADPQAARGRESVVLQLASREEQALVTVVDTGERRAISIIRTRESAR